MIYVFSELLRVIMYGTGSMSRSTLTSMILQCMMINMR